MGGLHRPVVLQEMVWDMWGWGVVREGRQGREDRHTF